MFLQGRQEQHLRRVLEVKVGQEVRIGLIDGPFGVGRVEDIRPETIELGCFFEPTPSPRPRVDLLLAMPRPKVMRRLWAPLASLGVRHIALTNAWRVERNYFDNHLIEPEIYRPLLLEGLEQAGHTHFPTVSIHRRLVTLVQEGLDGLFGMGTRLVAHPGSARRVRHVVTPNVSDRVLLAVGPEGGWIDREIDLLTKAGFQTITTGDRILSTSTAVQVLLGLIHDALED